MATQTRSIIWLDVAGFTTQTLIRSDPDASTIQAKMLLHSNADFAGWWEGPTNNNSSPAPVDAPYFTTADQARLLFLDTGGSLVTLNLHAPQLGIFLSDGVTVDPSAIADLTAAFIADGRSVSNLPIASYVNGNLLRRKVLV